MDHTSQLLDSPPQHDIFDVANWFLSKSSLQHKKLQKLCYYAVAWNYALLDSPLCKNDKFQAWVHGPVSPTLYAAYKEYGWIMIPQTTSSVEFESVDVLEFVWESYGDLNQFQLENLTHEEMPWQKARGSLGEFDHSEEVIDIEDMKLFYREQYAQDQND